MSSGDSGAGPYTGGCQCGAVRFSIAALGRPSLCHCRMCQKAFGAIGGALVTAKGLTWTRGALKHFQSSNKVRRGFCGECGTPLTFEWPDGVEVAICAFDKPARVPPVVQLAHESRIPWAETLAALPTRPASETDKANAYYASVVSYQHPDHDTDTWPPATRTGPA
jgi:hypothetical protein